MIEKRITTRRAMRPVDRQLMRPWLVALLNDQSVNGLRWIDKKNMLFEVKWRHGARQGWSISKDADVFERWARHTRKFNDGETPDPKRWKANFRCAVNSLPDIVEEKKESYTKGNNAHRVYRMLKGSERKKKKATKSFKIKCEQERLCLKSDGEDSINSDHQVPPSPDTHRDFEGRIPNFCKIEDTCSKNYRIHSPTGCSGGKVTIQDDNCFVKTEALDWTEIHDGHSSSSSSSSPSSSSFSSSDSGIFCGEKIELMEDTFELDNGLTYEDIPSENWNEDFIIFDSAIEPSVVTITNEDTCIASIPTALTSLESHFNKTYTSVD